MAHFSFKKKAHFSCIVLTFSYQFFKIFIPLLTLLVQPIMFKQNFDVENLLGTKLMSINHISYCKFNGELDVRVDWSLIVCLFVGSYWGRMKEKVWELRKTKRKRKKIRSNQLKETVDSA